MTVSHVPIFPARGRARAFSRFFPSLTDLMHGRTDFQQSCILLQNTFTRAKIHAIGEK